jgi:uncharacterized protein YutE (UPF0331/DUF86 family)
VTDPDVLARKLTLLQDQVARLRRRRPTAATALRDDADLQDALAMSLLVAVQTALDIALHIASDSGWGVPGTYADAFELLRERGALDADVAKRLLRMAALRNRLAHGYASVDFERVWTELPDGIAAFERFAAAAAKWLAP